MAKKVFLKIYQELRERYGKPKDQWKLWCKRKKTEREREWVAIEAILTQRTNWRNVEMAMNNLKKNKLDSLSKIYQLGSKRISGLIKPAGFYQQKAECLFLLAKFIIEEHGSLKAIKRERKEILREKLLRLKGIGPETADSILLYALDKPVFVIDEYTKRFVKERKIADNFSYSYLQNLFEKNLKKDFKLYQDFHALFVIDGKRKRQK